MISHPPREANRRVTIMDLARELGLAPSSVSAALNDHVGVSEETRIRVKELARQRGWRPHAGARALRTQKSRIAGVYLARDPKVLGLESFYPMVLAGIEEVLHAADHSLLLRMGLEESEQVYQRWHDEGMVDGAILFDAVDDDPRPSTLARLGTPAVLVGDFDVGPGESISTRAEDEAILLMQYVLGSGHQCILHIGGPARLRHEAARRRALDACARRAGVLLKSVESEYSLEAAARVAGQCLSSSQRPTAILAGSDLIALGVHQVLRESDARMPQDVSLLSWDDSLASSLVTPAITSLDRDPEALGRGAASLLLARLRGEELEDLVDLPAPRLVVRASSGMAPRR